MWKGPGQDPGGGPDPGPPPGSSQELSDLKDQFEQQQVLIAQLKEMIRKSEQSSVTQEKVDEYMNTLSKRSGRAKRVKKDDDNSNKKTLDIPASQKINLLRQQVEQNKVKFAERGKNQRGIEEMVTQLKAQMDDSHQLISQTPLNLSLQDAKMEYSENSSSQELYTVLLTKEKRISDLLAKVQKLEANVLDLQENVKEKDTVIDARTKAVTLMTENLSRKGKNTLDALDETKEQMRKMQENFVALESDMKARQMKLLDDLRLKNYEIAELQELNVSLEKQVGELKETGQSTEKELPLDTSNEELEAAKEEISRLERVITQRESTIKELNHTVQQINYKKDDEAENEELTKLRKQLDESNKNMIKVKAQHKSKVKELSKKIETFKKVSDANAEIVKLEAENCRLNQKLAELEEEKGSLQLKLVESDSAKGSDLTERENELEGTIHDHIKTLEEKDKVISILEGEIFRAKTEIETLTEKLNGLSHLENAQVKSEMASIQFEEQMDSLENENKKLKIDHENTNKEKEELLETIEILKKEKQEIAAKLEHYVQENIELIDKLEKLSAEKVSSAESIEIVENLTQQEKLELEAYQKNLDLVAGNLKSSEENLPQADLNESVNELTEETSELLQKIELFTIERREVMEKMEQLKQENNTLNLKIKEIENNRDVLAETYEQVQSEKELLDSKLANLETENESLKEKLRENSESDSFQARLDEECRKVEALQEELAKDKVDIEDKRVELENLQSQLEERIKEICQLNNTIIDLTRSLSDLENDNKSLQIKIEQLEEHTAGLSRQIVQNQEELEAVSNTEWESRRLLESKDNEITKLMKERDNTESVILDLQKTIKDKDEKFHKVSSDLKNKYLALQKQLEENSGSINNITGPLESRIEELTAKNKEQLEKMKKIAANLKKKTQAYQDLEEQLKETRNRHETELRTSLQQLQDLEFEVRRLQQQFDDKSEEVRVLGEKNVELQNVIADLRVKADKTNEMNLQQELLLTKENLGSVESSLQAKIQELEMMVETQESELVKSRERVSKLEEGISFVEERRLSLERKANDLGAQLEEKSVTCEEMSRSEDMLEKRVSALIAHDEAIERKLEESVKENQELNEQNKDLTEKNHKLEKKLEQASERIKEVEEQQVAVEDIATKNEDLKKQNHDLENELKNLQMDYEDNKNEFEKVNADWQTQFEEILQEKTELMVRCEKFEEELREITEKEIGFNNELLEYKTKMEKSQVEIKNYEEQLQKLSAENEELDRLRKMIEEKDLEIQSYQKQKETNNLVAFFDNVPQDPVRTEIESLNQLIQAKNAEILNYQSEKESLVNNFKEEMARSQSKIDELERKIGDFEVKKTAENAVESVIAEAEDRISPQKDIPTFVWSGQTEDPFDFVQQTAAISEAIPQRKEEPKSTENTPQELLEKIKTLEFMLYNAEKEKEEALLQSHELTNEVARLLYERQTLPATIVESQILQENEIRDTPDTAAELQKIEFEDTNIPVISSMESGPVVEEICQAKEAYLCHDNETQPQVSTIDSQILSDVDIVDTAETRRQLQQIEFEPTRTNPSQEEPCSSKDAYLCFNENDDGWGWGPEEAKLEEEHARKGETNDSLQTRIRVLEVERENHLEEIRQLQVKSGKLIKKLKEMKVRNEELRKKSDGDFFNLDDTMQEEFKLQIQQTEKRLKETVIELEKEKNDKKAISKKVDVLTAANERMVEMKEKQDVEMLGWQRKYSELSAKLERYEWGDDGFTSAESSTPRKTDSAEHSEDRTKKIEELNEIIKDLTLDNEELQTLLEEQRQLRIDAEKTAHQVDYSQIVKDKEALDSQLRVAVEENRQLQNQLEDKEALDSQLRSAVEENRQLQNQLEDKIELKTQLESFLENKNQLQDDLESTLEKNRQLQNELGSIVQEKNQLQQQLELSAEDKKQLQNQLNELIRSNSELLQRFESIENQNRELSELMASKEETIALLNQRIISVEGEKEVLFKELQEKNAQIYSLSESIDSQVASLRKDLEIQTKSAQDLVEEKRILLEAITSKDADVAKLSATMDQMVQEWEMRVDQRGSDVAESWKLHLEARETEFGQTEQLLRKEINELEEKTNALVIENNELRKNVDAEIRNEVDRVAALQQQINDRQQGINDLAVKLQEKQKETERLEKELSNLRNEKVIVDAILTAIQEDSGEFVVREGDALVKAFKDKQNEVIMLRRQIEDNQNKNSGEIILLRSQIEDVQTQNSGEIQRLVALGEEKDRTIASIHSQLEEMLNLKEYANENFQNLQQQLQVKNTQLEAKEREVNSLNLALEEKQREQSYALGNLSQEYRASIEQQAQEIEALKRRLLDNENHYEELIATKNSELESIHFELRNQSEMTQHKSKELEELAVQLSVKTEETTTLEQKITEQSVLLDEESKQLVELRAIIEDQVLKIEELKQELFQKSNDFDSLIAEMDMSRITVRENEETRRQKSDNDDFGEPASRAELDLALYMLHQRDVRCEELTVELTQLLEERDTLQLRLSNVIREKEELGRELKKEEEADVGSSSGVAPKINIEKAVEALDPLSTKLSELKSVGYKKDKTLVDEQELRRLQQMSFIEQHREAASKLPPEAAARLVDASYTLSRDVQSPSKVLLNWLRGRSTPKVNNV